MATEISLSGIYTGGINYLERFTSKKYWRIKLLLVLTFLSLLLSTGAYFYLPAAMKGDNWVSFTEKKERPFTQTNFSPASHAAKKTFRLTVPLLAKIFHLNNYLVFLLQFVVSILFLFFAILLVQKITGDAVNGLLTVTGLIFIYAGHAGFTDINTWFDEFAFLFLLLAMKSEKPILIFLFLQLASWTDERAVISSGLVFIWWKLNEVKASGFNFSSLFKFNWNSSIVILSVIVYAALRLMLSSVFGLHTPHEGTGLKVLLNDTDFMGMSLWTSLEGFWILLIVALIVFWKQRQIFFGFCLLSICSAIILASFSVFDMTRSGAYLFPVIFISILALKESFSVNDIRKVLVIVAIVCFLFPSYYIITDVSPYILWYKPIFIRIVDFLRIHFYGS